MRLRAELALIGVAMIWGLSFVIAKRALPDIPVPLYICLRFTLASITMAIIYRRHISAGFTRQQWLAGLWVGTILMSGFLFQTFGLEQTSPAKNAFLTGLYIVLVPFFSALFYRTRVGLFELLGVAFAVAGMFLLCMTGWSLHIAGGDSLTIVSAAVYALHIIVLGHFAPKTGYVSISLLQVSFACVASWIAYGVWSMGPASAVAVRWTPAVITAIVFGGLLCTALAFTLQSWGQQHTTTTRAALLMSLELVFAWIASYLFDGEVLAMRAAAGAVLILGGILVVELKPSANTEHPSTQVHP